MSTHKLADETARPDAAPAAPAREITEADQAIYERIIDTTLTERQVHNLTHPDDVYDKQAEVLAVHWHPEYIPLDVCRRRVDAMFPGHGPELVIPTQHNEILELGEWAGVEIDCYSSGFNRKVQLLLHLTAARARDAHALRSMCAHTFRYRSGQLYEFMDSITEPGLAERLQQAAAETGANEELVAFVRAHTAKLKRLMEANEAITPPQMIKNKLMREYFDALRGQHPDVFINRAQFLIKAVKKIVKANFSLAYFYRTSEVIEEVRALGGGVVIPHPEQFWPILLADYDVDGYEVWNPQSREYTEFLINSVNRRNRSLARGQRRILILMGDDTHMSEKVRDPKVQDRDKARREIGLQPAWDELDIAKSLFKAGADRATMIAEYKDRLA